MAFKGVSCFSWFVSDAHKPRLSNTEFRKWCAHLFAADSPDYDSEEDPRTLWETVKVSREITEGGRAPEADFSEKGKALLSDMRRANPPMAIHRFGPSSWHKHSAQLWENYRHIQRAVLTILDRSEPISDSDVGSVLEIFHEQVNADPTGATILVYPHRVKDHIQAEGLWVHPGPVGNGQLLRVAGLVEWVADDLQCSHLQAAAFLLCNLKTPLTWIDIRVAKRRWSRGDERLRIPDLPHEPRYEPGDNDLVFEIKVGSPLVTQRAIARAFGEAKRETLSRFAGRTWSEILASQMNQPLLDPWGEPRLQESLRRPRGQSTRTQNMVEFIEPRRDKGISWEVILREWRQAEIGTPYRDTRSSQNSYYAAKKRG